MMANISRELFRITDWFLHHKLFRITDWFRELREACRNNFPLSWYLSDIVVTSYSHKLGLENEFHTVRLDTITSWLFSTSNSDSIWLFKHGLTYIFKLWGLYRRLGGSLANPGREVVFRVCVACVRDASRDQGISRHVFVCSYSSPAASRRRASRRKQTSVLAAVVLEINTNNMTCWHFFT